jgi:hypothetical protein
VTTVLEADYLVVGAGAAGMAFTDALVNHADVRAVLVDRRPGAGGHWLDAYPFVRLHQASAFYGVGSTLLGGKRIQQSGPEAGLYERATQPEICDYYADVLKGWGDKVSFYGGHEHRGGTTFVSLETGEDLQVQGARLVDATYLAPRIPANTPPPFQVGEGAHVIPVNDLPHVGGTPSQYVVVGSGKTATDACVWLLTNGVDPDAIRWVRPRDPWMLNRAVVQPDPAVFLGMAADVYASAAEAKDADDLFLRLEDLGVMLRVDRSVTPTMAKAPTLAQWELDHLRTIEDVVRLGHIKAVERGRLSCAEGDARIAQDAVVVHCAADGLQYPPLVPIWQPDRITVQPVRAGFPCFGAAVSGYVEATVNGGTDDDAEKNRLCPPSPYPDTPVSWARMQAMGARSAGAFAANPDVKAWANTVAINPAAIPEGTPMTDALSESLERLAKHGPPGVAALAQLAGI